MRQIFRDSFRAGRRQSAMKNRGHDGKRRITAAQGDRLQKDLHARLAVNRQVLCSGADLRREGQTRTAQSFAHAEVRTNCPDYDAPESPLAVPVVQACKLVRRPGATGGGRSLMRRTKSSVAWEHHIHGKLGRQGQRGVPKPLELLCRCNGSGNTRCCWSNVAYDIPLLGPLDIESVL